MSPAGLSHAGPLCWWKWLLCSLACVVSSTLASSSDFCVKGRTCHTPSKAFMNLGTPEQGECRMLRIDIGQCTVVHCELVHADRLQPVLAHAEYQQVPMSHGTVIRSPAHPWCAFLKRIVRCSSSSSTYSRVSNVTLMKRKRAIAL